MKCLICGQIGLPGAKLCLDCKAARQRAFDATVTQPLLAAAGAARGSATARRLLKPSQSVPDSARRAAKIALAAQAKAKILIESPPRRARRWPIIVGAICIVVVVAGYLGHWFGAGKSDTFAAVPIEPPATQNSPAASSIVRSSTPGATAAPSVATEKVALAINAAAVLPPAVATKADAARPNARPRPEKAPIALPPADPLPPPVVAIVRPPPPPVVREAPRPDRWQLMNEAIARCTRADTSGRVSCEQRLRAQYCEGHWGQVAQCASIPYIDHGQ
ncbi:MAG TPA: hypothetical protein VN326_06500 [Casimicrobiaceae bacterium]|jgi:hypothetical protein|nr:hypothetical protein [Casimicrobiaceae bacterium]